jgi:hypothetical protein
MSMMEPIDPNLDVPPTMADPLEPPPTKWPKVIGIICTVLASLGLLCGSAGYFAIPMQRWGVDMQKRSGQSNVVAEAQLHAAEQYQVVTNVLLTLGMFLTIWLLIGSISLLRRRRSARMKLCSWAAISILLFGLNMALQVIMFQASSAELTQIGEGRRAGELWISIGIGGCIGIVFGLALQVFLLMWFSRKRIVAEVSQWP